MNLLELLPRLCVGGEIKHECLKFRKDKIVSGIYFAVTAQSLVELETCSCLDKQERGVWSTIATEIKGTYLLPINPTMLLMLNLQKLSDNP